jgi:protoporphyrinogen oxidase
MGECANHRPVAVVGGGFTDPTAPYALAAGFEVTLFETETELGGLAESFLVGDQCLEKFYHYWFTSDRYVQHSLA